MKQCTELRTKQTMQFTNPRSGRKVVLKAGEVLWVQSSEVSNKRDGVVMLGRQNMSMGTGWNVSLDQIGELFEVIA